MVPVLRKFAQTVVMALGAQYSSVTLLVFLLVFASFVTCLAQSGGSRQLRPRAFVPSGASITTQMRVDFEGDRVPEIVQMYSVPDASDSVYHTAGINVLKFNPQSGWMLAYRETESIEPGALLSVPHDVSTDNSSDVGGALRLHPEGGSRTLPCFVRVADDPPKTVTMLPRTPFGDCQRDEYKLVTTRSSGNEGRPL